MEDLGKLISLIGAVHTHFMQQVQRQVNTALTLRNWLFGLYIVEYEHRGSDRAAYGRELYKEIARGLQQQGIAHIRERHLYLCKDFYNAYRHIQESATVADHLSVLQKSKILRTASAKSEESDISGKDILQSTDGKEFSPSESLSLVDADTLLHRLSFSHFIELLKSDTPLKRSFYEVEAVKNNWSVRELQRAMNSMLYERTGLSRDKEAVLEKHRLQDRLLPENILRNPYILEFLGLKEESEYSETQLEEAIINHLQSFLLEMGRGFCFEARQKRITFDNTHYHIDLVFYHRILHCNVLIDLKIGEFTHADAGQMTVYLNYYNEEERHEGDNPPVGIILCAGKNANLVKYATTGLPQQVFVNTYMLNLPNEEDLRKIIAEAQRKIHY